MDTACRYYKVYFAGEVGRLDISGDLWAYLRTDRTFISDKNITLLRGLVQMLLFNLLFCNLITAGISFQLSFSPNKEYDSRRLATYRKYKYFTKQSDLVKFYSERNQ